MNIKDPRVHVLAHELASRKGTSATAAVREALEHELERMSDDRDVDWAVISNLQERVARAPGLMLTDEDLYDVDGLPR